MKMDGGCQKRKPVNNKTSHRNDIPDRVKAVPQLKNGIQSLLTFFRAPHPTLRYVTSNATSIAIYGFGDASGAGFGNMISLGERIHFCHGIWGKDHEGDTSNYRELNNLVRSWEEGVSEGHLCLY